jgi:hypothetical protein
VRFADAKALQAAIGMEQDFVSPLALANALDNPAGPLAIKTVIFDAALQDGKNSHGRWSHFYGPLYIPLVLIIHAKQTGGRENDCAGRARQEAVLPAADAQHRVLGVRAARRREVRTGLRFAQGCAVATCVDGLVWTACASCLCACVNAGRALV